ncbi:hypothetical protein ACFL0E_00110 [Nanoarchaeota archaeon]
MKNKISCDRGRYEPQSEFDKLFNDDNIANEIRLQQRENRFW